jgi:hypothetical protein
MGVNCFAVRQVVCCAVTHTSNLGTLGATTSEGQAHWGEAGTPAHQGSKQHINTGIEGVATAKS